MSEIEATPQVGELLESLPTHMDHGQLIEKLKIRDTIRFDDDHLQLGLAARPIDEMTTLGKSSRINEEARLVDKGPPEFGERRGGQ